MDENVQNDAHMTRRRFLGKVARGAFGAGLAGVAGAALVVGKDRLSTAGQPRQVWQIDPLKCVQCGQCRTHCVLEESAVECVHDFSMCGYCELCMGFFPLDPIEMNEGAENQLCPVGAIQRRFIEGEQFEYRIDESRCTGCGTCVKYCTQSGNGSLYLQVRQDRCLNCNQCSIAAACPADAFIRRPADKPYVVKHRWIEEQGASYVSRFRPPDFESGYVPPKFLQDQEGEAE